MYHGKIQQNIFPENKEPFRKVTYEAYLPIVETHLNSWNQARVLGLKIILWKSKVEK